MVAPKKSSSALSLIPEERGRIMPSSSKSTESLYSNTSSSKGSATILYRRKASNNRPPTFIPATTDVRQRVLSARRLRIQNFQNQLADAHQHIAELSQENRMLRTLHKRQDLALSKYENTNAELPQLLHSHAEEIRVWQMKYRNLQAQNKELLYKLKQKEGLILSITDQNKYLSQLNKDKNLEERQRLAEKVQYLETRLQEKETDMKLLARRLQLETKNAKKDIQSEQKKRKEAMVQLEKAKLELSGYVKIDELNMNEKLSKLSIGSMANLNNGIHANEDRISMSQTLLTPLDKKANDNMGEQTSRSVGSEESELFTKTSRNTQLLSANKLVGKTSTHRGNGDGPSDEDENLFTKSVRLESTSEAHISVDAGESKLVENNYYDEDYEDTDEEPDEIESLLRLTKKERPLSKTSKSNDMTKIRKELTEDFNKRESFLNTFCRQSTANSAGTPERRKNKLLAVLKNMEGETSN